MPDCGEPVPLVETARRLAGWYRPEHVPYPIACTGIRPGERLHEVLLSPNESFGDGRRRRPAPRATRRPRETARAGLDATVDELSALVASGDRDALGAALPGQRPSALQ